MDMLRILLSDKDLPRVHSLSVGESEQEFANDNGGPDAITRMNTEMMAIGARGVSILFASGDSGYVAAQKFGAASPYVTAVGGVFMGDVLPEPLQVDPISTGGFSSLDANPIQEYQKSAVAHYLQTKGARPGKLQSNHRCVPDISAFDADIYIVTDGSDTPVRGTSASTPIVAGMMSLINDVLLLNGLSPLGFLNPFLYQNQDVFLDVTRGSNNGFDAVEGYDPASGLGTFNATTFEMLLQRALAAKKEFLH